MLGIHHTTPRRQPLEADTRQATGDPQKVIRSNLATLTTAVFAYNAPRTLYIGALPTTQRAQCDTAAGASAELGVFPVQAIWPSHVTCHAMPCTLPKS